MTPGYYALRERAAWLDLSGRGKIVLRGEDRARLLHAMTTNNVQPLKPGQGCYAFFLNAQGRILADANLLCFPEHILVDTEAETRQKVFEHLDRYIIADDVTLADETDLTPTVAIEGPQAAAVLEALGSPIPEAPYAWLAWGTRTVARVNSTGSEGFFVFLPGAEKETLLAELSAAGVEPVSDEEARIVRLEHGRPRYGEEITERYLVQETSQLHAVHFTKGCYLGQEIVERVRSRGQVHRGLRRLELETAEVPPAGSKLTTGLTSGDAAAAEIASAAFSPALGKVVALAYVRTQFNQPGADLLLGDIPARVV